MILVKRSVKKPSCEVSRSRRQRTAPSPDQHAAMLVDALRDHRRDRYREIYGADYDTAADLVSCRPDGRLWKPSAFTSAYRDLLRRRKLPAINFHKLRHSHASQLLR